MALKDKLVNLEDLKAAYDDLKEKIDNMLKFSSVTAQVTASGASGSIICNKSGNLVEIEVSIDNASQTITVGTTLGTTPAGYRPKSKIYCRSSEQRTGGEIQSYIDTDGKITTANQVTSFSNTLHVIRFWFLTD